MGSGICIVSCVICDFALMGCGSWFSFSINSIFDLYVIVHGPSILSLSL